MQSVKADGGLLKASDEFGAEWKLAAGGPRKKDVRGRSALTAAVPSVHLRLDGEFRASMIAAWCLNASQPGADMLVRWLLTYFRIIASFCMSVSLAHAPHTEPFRCNKVGCYLVAPPRAPRVRACVCRVPCLSTAAAHRRRGARADREGDDAHRVVGAL